MLKAPKRLSSEFTACSRLVAKRTFFWWTFFGCSVVHELTTTPLTTTAPCLSFSFTLRPRPKPHASGYDIAQVREHQHLELLGARVRFLLG